MENAVQHLRPTLPTIASRVFVLALLYRIIVIIYRLCFHPLASFPGPKLAGVTVVYEAYYDIWKGGKYIFKVNELHQRYGKY